MEFRKMVINIRIPSFTRLYKNEIVCIGFESVYIIDVEGKEACRIKFNEIAVNIIINNSKAIKIT